jgi:hypothetical protein
MKCKIRPYPIQDDPTNHSLRRRLAKKRSRTGYEDLTTAALLSLGDQQGRPHARQSMLPEDQSRSECQPQGAIPCWKCVYARPLIARQGMPRLTRPAYEQCLVLCDDTTEEDYVPGSEGYLGSKLRWRSTAC